MHDQHFKFLIKYWPRSFCQIDVVNSCGWISFSTVLKFIFKSDVLLQALSSMTICLSRIVFCLVSLCVFVKIVIICDVETNRGKHVFVFYEIILFETLEANWQIKI